MSSLARKQFGDLPKTFTQIALLIIVAIGLYFRFNWVDWHQGANLHPDEYGLTNTLTQLRMPSSFEEYLNTRISPISPYQKYDETGSPTAPGPDNRMRWGQWPIILIRGAGELTGQVGYDEIRVLGRRLSALADFLSVILLLVIGKLLYGRSTGLLAAALSALAVMQIQQSHFMTVDNFGTLFTAVGIYAAVRISQLKVLRPTAPVHGQGLAYVIRPVAVVWSALFGVSLGMAVASRINLLPLGGMIGVALFIAIADLRIVSKNDLVRIFSLSAILILVSFLAAGLTFRIAHPMSFRASTGDTSLFTLTPNPDWVESMRVAMNESRGIGGGPPAQQWANRPAIVYPLMNMVVWGMGVPLGLAAWSGFIWAIWSTFRHRVEWRSHLIPLIWVGGYFLFMGTRWVMSMRYFLPIYPLLALFGAWGLKEVWRTFTTQEAKEQPATSDNASRYIVPSALSFVVVVGTLIYARGFVRAVYVAEHTRLRASEWILENVPGPLHLTYILPNGEEHSQPIPGPNEFTVSPSAPYSVSFEAAMDGELARVETAHSSPARVQSGDLVVSISPSTGQASHADTALLTLRQVEKKSYSDSRSGEFGGMKLQAGRTYQLQVQAPTRRITISRSVLSNESWDEGLPVRIAGYDPYGALYRGLTMEVRWYDDEAKREMFIRNLAQADYVILPSQRGIWSTPRLPHTYPMTIEYYRALFDGRLGFDQVAVFHSPVKIGPVYISDLAGTVSWGRPPALPVFNFNPLAAEEAFSVYDHPPVWIFKKRHDFSLAQVAEVLSQVDLDQVIIQSPREADTVPLE